MEMLDIYFGLGIPWKNNWHTRASWTEKVEKLWYGRIYAWPQGGKEFLKQETESTNHKRTKTEIQIP